MDWDKESDLRTGIRVLDEEHTELSKLLSEVDRAAREDEDWSTIQLLLARIAKASCVHFGVEKALMRVNNYPRLPVHANPITIGPLYLVAYQIGRLLVGGDGAVTAPAPDMDWSHPGAWMEAFGEWMLSLGKPLGIGLVALALALAVLGYLVVHVTWRAYVVRAWRRRALHRSHR